MNRSLLLSAAVAACLALPSVSLADPPPDNARKKEHQDQGRGGGQHVQGGPQAGSAAQSSAAGSGSGGAGDNGAVAAHRRSPATSGAQTQDRPHGGQVQARHDGQTTPEAQSTGSVGPRSFSGAAARRTTSAAPNAQAQQSQQRSGQPQRQSLPVASPPAPLTGWNPTLHGSARDQASQQWRQQRQGWDRDARWRQDPNWWRQDSGFQLYRGLRVGYFFIPGTGYLAIPQQYRSRYWREGDYLPGWFRRHVVRDYRRYGLPRPPYGCTWVWLQGAVALVDRSDGYILDMARNVW